ncbi:ROK family transcriptional regulator [Galactobacter caseinivorans]|uniref:ROK family transcriptional regulator n=1 Tax=Galactobacter caseinivorans TaxID=2676123 RepID=A0A496PJ75_9MICC|nr:ROK family transcriptional regulator [Galactobacter caseinivorans]RKW70470.1 ROK family transcriptional regulator [Galactobacter caseinivorans]
MSLIDTSDVTTLRRFNAETILDVLRAESRRWFTVRELALGTGLSRPTVARVLDDLAGNGWVISVAGTPGETGRPARRFTFNRRRGVVLSYDSGNTIFLVVASDLAGEPLATASRQEENITDQNAVVPVLCELADEVMAKVQMDVPVLGVGVALPGAINEAGVLTDSAFAPTWIGLDLRPQLEEAFPDAVISLGHDVETTTAAELKSGALQGVNSALHIHFLDKPSATLVVDGQLVRGARGLAGVRPRARKGREGHSSDWMALRNGLYEGHQIQRMSALVAAAQSGDQEYIDLLTRYAEGLAPRIAFLTRAIDPEVVLIGGQMLALPEILTGPMTRAIRIAVGREVEVRLAKHPFEQAAPLGGVYAALDAIEWVS